MKKLIIVSTLIATTLSSSAVFAEPSKEENIGVASGAVVGAAVGGPVGFIVGAAIGAVFGENVHKANKLDDANLALEEAKSREIQLQEEMSMIRENMQLNAQQSNYAKWLSEGITLNIMFTTNSSALSTNDYENIEKIADILNQYAELNLKLDGYSDPRGSQQDNLTLSQQRVDSVVAHLESLGIASDRIIGTAHGEKNLDASQLNGTEKAKQDLDAFAMARKVSVNFVAKSQEQIAQN